MTELAFSVAEKVIERLASLSCEVISLRWGIASDLKNLKLTMSTLKAVLLDAEEKQAKNRHLSVWLGELKDVFYDAMDVLDAVECENQRREVMKKHGTTVQQVHDFVSSFNPFGFNYQMSHKIREIRESVEKIGAVRSQFHLEERFDDKRIVHREGGMSHSFVPPSYVIGRGDDKEKLIDFLLQPGDDDVNVSVIPIVGIGGMGKTVLAQSVYNDERAVINFDSRTWVCMSKDFNVLNLAKEMLINPASRSINDLSMDQVQVSVRDSLKGKIFLLVLDDVWNDDRSKWIDLKNLLMEGAKGSKIVVTTRDHKVASMMSTGLIYDIEVLPEDDCLSLLLRWAFSGGEEKKYPKLVEIGKEIVKKCKGVPLAVKTLGSLLYSKSEERDWIFIRDSEIWKLEQKDDDILHSLRLSYDQLPSYLKPCFAYCSLYPKGHIYESIELTQSWMANGLLQMSKGSNQEFEDIGLQYVKELFSRSLIEELFDVGHCFIFKMHDLVHDLSLYVAQSDHCLIEKDNGRNNYEKIRHLSILDETLGVDGATTLLDKFSNGVRTIIIPKQDEFPLYIYEDFVEICISRFKYLRLLDLVFSCFEVLPSSISALKHLRYLSFGGNKEIKKLPNSICDLQNLETLVLTLCEKLEELPRDIRKMINIRVLLVSTKQKYLPNNGIECLRSLRALGFMKCPKLESLPEGIQQLINLRILGFSDCESLISLPRGCKWENVSHASSA